MGDELGCTSIGKEPSKGSLYNKMEQIRDYTDSLKQRLDTSISKFRGLDSACAENGLCENHDRVNDDFLPLLQTEEILNDISGLLDELDKLGRLYKDSK